MIRILLRNILPLLVLFAVGFTFSKRTTSAIDVTSKDMQVEGDIPIEIALPSTPLAKPLQAIQVTNSKQNCERQLDLELARQMNFQEFSRMFEKIGSQWYESKILSRYKSMSLDDDSIAQRYRLILPFAKESVFWKGQTVVPVKGKNINVTVYFHFYNAKSRSESETFDIQKLRSEKDIMLIGGMFFELEEGVEEIALAESLAYSLQNGGQNYKLLETSYLNSNFVRSEVLTLAFTFPGERVSVFEHLDAKSGNWIADQPIAWEKGTQKEFDELRSKVKREKSDN